MPKLQKDDRLMMADYSRGATVLDGPDDEQPRRVCFFTATVLDYSKKGGTLTVRDDLHGAEMIMEMGEQRGMWAWNERTYVVMRPL